MAWDKFIFAAFVGLVATGSAFAGDPPATPNGQANFPLDSRMILSPAGEHGRSTSTDEGHDCFMMRTYRVRKDMDRSSVIPAKPGEAAFSPDDIVGYSTCQKASKFGVKSTR